MSDFQIGVLIPIVWFWVPYILLRIACRFPRRSQKTELFWEVIDRLGRPNEWETATCGGIAHNWVQDRQDHEITIRPNCGDLVLFVFSDRFDCTLTFWQRCRIWWAADSVRRKCESRTRKSKRYHREQANIERQRCAMNLICKKESS